VSLASIQTRHNSPSFNPALADVTGRERYPDMNQLMIAADCGGSNGSRVRLFRVELQNLADETGLMLPVYHYPPETSN
jgi:hypothetical protein